MKKILFSAIAIVAMVGCSKTESIEIENWDGELQITSGIETRASETTWEANDAIGVFMSNTGTTTAIGAHNTKYTTSSTTSTAEFTADTGTTPLYYPQSGSVDIVAHYPHNASSSVDSYPVDVTDQDDLTAIDFMSSKVVGVAKSSTALDLKFYHLLSQVKVVLEPATDGGLTTDDLKSATVTISGTKATATATLDYDTTNSKPTASYVTSGNATDLSVTAASSTAKLIVVPQSATVTFTITVANAGVFVSTISSVATFASGDEHTYTISVSKTAVTIKEATFKGWDSGNTGDSLDALFDWEV